MHDAAGMDPDEFEEPVRRVKRVDVVAVRVLKEHLAKQEREPRDGIVIDRSFVVVEPDYHDHR